jgi:hypothetical protein
VCHQQHRKWTDNRPTGWQTADPCCWCQLSTTGLKCWQWRPRHYMAHRLSWQANSSSTTQEIPHILWNPKIHCRNHKSPPSKPWIHPSPIRATCHAHLIILDFITRKCIWWRVWSIKFLVTYSSPLLLNTLCSTGRTTRWFKYDRDKLWLLYTQIVPVIFEPQCICIS